MLDAYEQFFSKGYISKQQLFEFGLNETLYAPLDKVEQEWTQLKDKIRNNETVYIRGYGRDAAGTSFFLDLHRQLFGNNNVQKDPTNNAAPAKLIAELTGYSKTRKAGLEPICNYQVSHIFGRTKNIYAFTAPWNIAYIPKILDPFTGHEARGDAAREYRALFQKQAYDRFRDLIEDFNALMTPAKLAIFKNAVEAELSPILALRY